PRPDYAASRYGASCGSGTHPCRLHPDASDHGAAGGIERLAIIAPGEIGQAFRRQDGAEMLALRRNDPDAAGAAVPDIALRIDLHAVGKARAGIRTHVDEGLAVRHRAVRLHVIAVDLLGADIIDIERLLVGRERNAIRRLELAVEQRELAVLEAIDAGVRHAFGRVLVLGHRVLADVGEIDRAVGFDDEV